MVLKMTTYAEAGVDREARAEAKKKLGGLESTYRFSEHGKIIKTPFNALYPIDENRYQVKTCDGVGTKVLLAQLADKHDTIGIDAVAMVVNDCIRCGARPIAITDVIDIKKSEPGLLMEIQKGLNKGATESECPLTGGETADVPELMKATYHINCDCVGEVEKDKIITGESIEAGNVIIGLRSSGIHSNGVSLVRRVLFKAWGGEFEAFEKIDGLEKELIFEVLEPTRIYVKPFLKVFKEYGIKAAVHITGDAYLKFGKLIGAKNIGFEFDNFKPQPIFDIVQKTGNVEASEMFKTFNMGWGFALIVDDGDADDILDLFEKNKIESEVIGKVVEKRCITIRYKGENIEIMN